MASNTTTADKSPDGPADLPSDAPAAVRDLAQGKEVDAKAEDEVLAFLLGPTQALEYDVTVQYETPTGLRPLTFHLRQMDGDRLDQIDSEHRAGDGPFAKLDTLGFNCAVVAEATIYIAGETGKRVDPSSAEFRGGVPSTELALRARFKKQSGLLEGIVEQVRQKAGYASDRVGTAQRSLVTVGKP